MKSDGRIRICFGKGKGHRFTWNIFLMYQERYWWIYIKIYLILLGFSGSAMWVGSTGIRVGSAHPGEEDAWHASARVGRRLAGEWWRVRPCPTSDFDAVFTSGFVSSSSTQWYSQNTILTTFIFEQKSNTPLNHVRSDTNCWGFRPVMYWYLLIGG